ncbi:MAG: transporter substrate-binding domain-containing protein [Rhodospirillales bacterium]|nr:transporter substrate-binding domain-containing protein [Rhodospirillales bacterium]
MKAFSKLALGACLALAAFAPTQGFSQEIKVLTTNSPPYAIEKGDQKGFMVDLVHAIADVLGTKVKVEFMPWEEAQKLAKDSPNTLIFPFSKTPAREANFNWVIEIWEVKVGFATMSDKPKVASLDQAKGLKAIGVPAGSPWMKKLKDEGLTNLVDLRGPAAVEKLVAGEIDAIYDTVVSIQYNWLTSGAAGKPNGGMTPQTLTQFIAGSKNSPAIKIDEWQGAYEVVKEDGTFDKIYKKYFGS